MKPFVAALSSALLLAACVTAPPNRYYTLDMRPAGAGAASHNLSIDHLRLAEALTRKDILIQVSPTRIEYYASDQWVASLDELVTRKLSSEFGEKRSGRPGIVISGGILAFEQVDQDGGAAGHVTLELGFHAAEASRYDVPLLEKTYDVQIPAEKSNAAAVVVALSRCLEQIAAAIVNDVSNL